jgi:hypothetical protein
MAGDERTRREPTDIRPVSSVSSVAISLPERFHDFCVLSGLSEVELFLAKNPVGGILTDYTYH